MVSKILHPYSQIFKATLKYMSPLIQQQFCISHGLNQFYACFNLNCLNKIMAIIVRFCCQEKYLGFLIGLKLFTI